MARNTFKGKDGSLLGGNSLSGVEVSEGGLVQWNVPQGDVRGVYAQNPATTPKYHTGNGDVTKEYMARMLIPFASDKARNLFVDSVPPASRPLASNLAASGNTPYGLGYIDFLLQSVQEQFTEKVQVVDAVGDNYIAYYLGQNPPTFQYAGTLLNSYQDDWRSAFTALYNDVLRGTMLARRKVIVVLAYDDVMVTGSLNNLSQMLTADFELKASFSFSLLVKRYDFSSRSPRANFKPTPVASYPYNIKPGAFSNVPIAQAKKSIWNADTVTYTTSNQRKKGSESDTPGLLETIGLKMTGFDPDPDVSYISDTVYNAAIGPFIVAPEASDAPATSDALDYSFFDAPQSVYNVE